MNEVVVVVVGGGKKVEYFSEYLSTKQISKLNIYIHAPTPNKKKIDTNKIFNLKTQDQREKKPTNFKLIQMKNSTHKTHTKTESVKKIMCECIIIF